MKLLEAMRRVRNFRGIRTSEQMLRMATNGTLPTLLENQGFLRMLGWLQENNMVFEWTGFTSDASKYCAEGLPTLAKIAEKFPKLRLVMNLGSGTSVTGSPDDLACLWRGFSLRFLPSSYRFSFSFSSSFLSPSFAWWMPDVCGNLFPTSVPRPSQLWVLFCEAV